MTCLTSDGAELIDKALGIKSPLLAINTLRTESDSPPAGAGGFTLR